METSCKMSLQNQEHALLNIEHAVPEDMLIKDTKSMHAKGTHTDFREKNISNRRNLAIPRPPSERSVFWKATQHPPL